MKILVTGGASGLGVAIVRQAAAVTNNTVYFTYASSATAAAEIERLLPNTRGFYCDFKVPATVDAFLTELSTLEIDILVNNAYVGMSKEHYHKTDSESFLLGFEQNIMPALRITQETLKTFRKQKSGRIVNIITSAILNKPPLGLSGYVANKAYMLSMSNSWAAEYARLNITSNCVSPSFMETPLTSYTDERLVEQMKEEHPLKKLLTLDEVAATVLFYFTCSNHINGTNLVLNAGMDIA